MHKVDQSELTIRPKLVKLCTYCNEPKPIKVWKYDPEVIDSKDRDGNPGYYRLVMFEVANLQKDKKVCWICNECLSDIKQNSKGKIIQYNSTLTTTLDPPV